ncbi:2-C-methyl-D-erythritol 4-phosphate cytidylyltransferase [Fodinicola acaciae]|uniref:2-C-methyl-D-erythritol 4-phosphate cytidylyltransferase n=1 Tax=Fodinicola acaciae TaxID=2681555 RepID=UPI0013D39F1D|nr:2-C-methyl-D-erythritol 4-phosphate cytidylyltransferase [Fodinicola acaciae]
MAAILWAATFSVSGGFPAARSFPRFVDDVIVLVRSSDRPVSQRDGGVRIIPIPQGISLADALAIGVGALPDDVDQVLLYDGEEPSADALEVLDGVGDGWCVALADMTETVKIVDAGLVTGTLDRDTVLRVRTPQAATRAALAAVIADAGFSFSAMPSRAARLGIPVTTVR